MRDFIQGDKFKALTRNIYAPSGLPHNKVGNFVHSDYRHLVTTFDRRLLKDNDIIYTHNFYADQLFEYIENVDKKLIIITHNADSCMNFLPPDNVMMWYAQNVGIKNPRVQSIPIGVENDRWFANLNKKGKMDAIVGQRPVFKNLVYMNFNIDTAPAKRQPVYDLFKDERWVTSRMGKNGGDFDDYLDNIHNHPFVLCPEGNGMDTHRTWECLYVNSIPIEKRNINNQFYTDLPICFVDEWDEVTEIFLFEEYKRITEKKWNMDKLTFGYWKRLINERDNSKIYN